MICVFTTTRCEVAERKQLFLSYCSFFFKMKLLKKEQNEVKENNFIKAKL